MKKIVLIPFLNFALRSGLLPQNPLITSLARKSILMVLLLFLSVLGWSQAPVARFESVVHPNCHGLSKAQIDTMISHVSFENFRLQAQRDTLLFDNGFEIILLSATELQTQGLVVAAYQSAFPRLYKKPIFHINQAGQISAAYETANTK